MASGPFTESLRLSYRLAVGFCFIKSFCNPMLLWPYTALLCAPFIPSTLCTDAIILMAPPIPTMSFHTELLTAMHTAQPVSACLAAVPLVMVCTHFSHGASVNGLMV